MKRPAIPDPVSLRRPLLVWYSRSRRDLPWRRTQDTYHIWVSEVMLQQTRVQAVIPYYEKFLNRFPNVQALANAPDEELLACWSGLGYYSRARNLQKAARAIVEEHGSVFPNSYAAARALPGVGAYTAAAVLSIAYGVPLPVLDGNAARVLARVFAVAADIRRPRGKQRLMRLAEAALSPRRPGDFNQALMELGALICVPGQPHCGVCPLRSICRSFSTNRTDEFPPPRRMAAAMHRRYVAAVVLDGAGNCLLRRRPSSAKVMPGFWELPMLEHASATVPPHTRAGGVLLPGIHLDDYAGCIRHSITTNRMEVAVYQGRVSRRLRASERWVPVPSIPEIPATTITRKALRLVVS